MSTTVDSAAATDRLVSTLFLATLFHGILIMGITFRTALPEMPEATPTLEVVMVQEGADATVPDNASYLAARASTGGGNTTERVRASGQLTTGAPVDSAGVPDGALVPPSEQGPKADPNDLLVSPNPSDRTILAIEDATTDPNTAVTEPLLMEASPNAVLLEETDGEIRAQSDNLREQFISVDTREATFASYLSGWKQKIEQVGTLNFPDQARRSGLAGNPVLEVAIKADGDLHEIIVRRSSGHRILDQAALRILRLAAPFDPFPDALAGEYDVLRFVYEWQFLDGSPVGSSLATTESGGK